MIDPWGIALLAVFLAIAGPSPTMIPICVYMVYGDHVELWAAIVKTFPGDWMLFLLLPSMSVVIYWINGLVLLLIDTIVRPEVLQTYKIQKGQTFDKAQLGRVIRNIIFNQIFVIFPFSISVAYIKRFTGFGPYLSLELPDYRERCVHLIGFILVDEFLFYYAHRLLHHRSFYAKFHKLHHEFSSPIGLTAMYCHPVEMLVANVIPLFMGTVLFSSHLYMVLGWVVFGVLGTQTHHCGYHWPWMGFCDHPSFHDFHHEKFTCNFGSLTWLDKLHGTDKPWVEFNKGKAKARAAKAE